MKKTKIKVVTALGTRPEITKLSPILPVFDKEFNHKLIHTGQHYSSNMDSVFFKELKLRKPDYHLDVGSSSHGDQTAKMLIGIEKILAKEKPDYLVVFADPNTPLAGALAGSKMHIPVVHMEAGLRSFNREMPEEINRIVADHVSEILLAPDKTAYENLKREGLTVRKVFVVGSTAYTACLRNREIASKNQILDKLRVTPGEYILATIHRAENTRNSNVLNDLVGALNEISKKKTVVFPIHPGTRKLMRLNKIKKAKNVIAIEPQGYMDFLKLLDNAAFVMSDSGGIQEEAAALNTPCIVLRNETEWTYLLKLGKNVMVGTKKDKILKIVNGLLKNENKLVKMRKIKVNYKKNIAKRIVEIIKNDKFNKK